MAKSNLVGSNNPDSKMAALLEKEEYSPRSLSRGQLVEGAVVSKTKDALFVDLGAKSEGVISAKELESLEEFEKTKVGDKITAFVMIPESEGGQVILSLKKAGSERRWQDISKTMEEDGVVEVKPLESNRGGLLVDYDGLRGFIPSSHLISSARAGGEPIKVKILEVDKKLNRLIFSEREAGSESTRLPKVELPFGVGDSIEGKVSKMLPFGVLITVAQGLEGLVHISEISWERVENLDKLFKIGDSVKARVVDIDASSGKVNLSIKQLTQDPWQKAADKYPVGKKFEAEISRTSSYGAFVQLEPGIEGLIHSSKIPYGTKLAPADKVSVSIDLFNPEQRRVALRLETDEGTKETKVTKGPKVKETKPKKGKVTKSPTTNNEQKTD